MKNLNEQYRNNSTVQEAILKLTSWMDKKLCVIYNTPSLHDEQNGMWTVFVDAVISDTPYYNKFGGLCTKRSIHFKIMMDTNVEDEPRFIDERNITIDDIYNIGIDTIIKNIDKVPFRVMGMSRVA